MTTVRFSDTAAGGQASTPGAAAWACSRLGLRVFPLVIGTGTPALKRWPELATLDENQIMDWWCGEYTGHGVGVATGPESGVWALDIDVKHGADGFATLAALREGRDTTDAGDLGRTLTVATPSGGAHLYFRWPNDGGSPIANSTGASNALGRGLDVRGVRGYVRAPGWGGYQVVPRDGIRHTRIASAPLWLLDLARTKPARSARATGADGSGEDGTWEGFSVHRTLTTLARAEAGERNTVLNKTAYKLGRWGSLTESDAWASCKAIMARIGAGDSLDAQRRTFDSGWNAGAKARDSILANQSGA